MRYRFILGLRALVYNPSVLAKANDSIEFMVYSDVIEALYKASRNEVYKWVLEIILEAMAAGLLTIRQSPPIMNIKSNLPGEQLLTPLELSMRSDIQDID